MCAGTEGVGGAHGAGISMCDIQFAWIAGLKFRMYTYVSCMFGGNTGGGFFDWMLICNPLCVCSE